MIGVVLKRKVAEMKNIDDFRYPDPPAFVGVIGLCGSGKTFFMKNRAPRSHNTKFFDEGVLHDGELLREFIDEVRLGRVPYVSDAELLTPSGRAKLMGAFSRAGVQTHPVWICFSNDLETANHNCRFRTNKGSPDGHERLNSVWHMHYVYPDGAIVVPLYRLAS